MEKFDGFHKEITKSFARAFDGVEVEIGDIKFTMTESFFFKLLDCLELEKNGLKTEVLRENTGSFL